MAARPAIPEALQRRVRQHCGFGCSICGAMPTQIEHIVPYSDVKSHEFENLTLLCTMHHQEVTSGRLSKKQVEDSRRSPFSSGGNSSKYFPFLRDQTFIEIGKMRFAVRPGLRLPLFRCFGEEPIVFTFGKFPLFDITILDRRGRVSLKMKDNVFDFKPMSLWDVKLSGQRLKVRLGAQRTLLHIEISDSTLVVKSLRLAFDRMPIVADKHGIHFVKQGLIFGGLQIQGSANGQNAGFGFSKQDKGIIGVPINRCDSHAEAWDMAMKYKHKVKPRSKPHIYPEIG